MVGQSTPPDLMQRLPDAILRVPHPMESFQGKDMRAAVEGERRY